MAITYNAGTDTILLTGNSEAVPLACIDIWNADQAGAWGQFTKLGSKQFLCAAKVRVGVNGGAAGHFGDSAKNIVFSKTVGADGIIMSCDNGTMRFGSLVDATNKTVKDGCSIYFEDAAGNYYALDTTTNGTMNLYGCHIWSAGGKTAANRVRSRSAGGRVWHCLLDACQLTLWGADASWFDVYIVNAKHGMDNPAAGEVAGIYLDDCAYGLLLGANAIDKVGTDITNRGSDTNDIWCLDSFDGDYFLDNPDFDSYSFKWHATSNGTVYVRYPINLQFLDKGNNGIEDMTVTLVDKNDLEIFSELTDADGKITEQMVKRGYYNRVNASTLQDYSPHTLEVKKGGWEAVLGDLTLDELINWRTHVKQSLPIRILDGKPILALRPESARHDRILHTQIH